MVTTGKFVFKNITLRDKGSFTDIDGNIVEYPETYILKVDEVAENGDINERKFKVDKDKVRLVNELKQFKAYDDIDLTFKITLYATRCSLELIEVAGVEE